MNGGQGLEGMGRVLAARTKQEAAGVTVAVAIPRPERVAPLPVAPAAKDKEFDPKISDVWRAEDLGVQESENLPREVVDDTASRKLPVTETQCLAVCCGGSEKNQSAPMPQRSCDTGQAPEATPALEARLVSTVKEKSMKWQTFVIGVLSLVVGALFAHGINVDKKLGDLAAHNAAVDKKVDVLAAWYVDSQFGSPAALEGKTCLEITPQMQELGIERFVSIAERLPYADAETMDGLIKRNIRKISGIWRPSNSDARTIVRLESLDGMRSVLAHVNPASVSVYTYKFATSTQEYTIYSWNYSWWCDNIKHPAIKEEQTAVK